MSERNPCPLCSYVNKTDINTCEMCGSHLTREVAKKKKQWDSWDLTQSDIETIGSSEESQSDNGSPSSMTSIDSTRSTRSSSGSLGSASINGYNLPEQREIFYNAVHWGDYQRVVSLWNECKSESNRRALLVYRSPSARMDYGFSHCKVLPTPLAWACWQGHNRVVEFLLLHNAPVNGHDDDGENSPLFRAVLNNKFEIVKMLANHRCKLDEVSSVTGLSAFQAACQGLSTDIVEHFVTCGLNPSDQERDKYHPLVRAAIERGRYNLLVREEARTWLLKFTSLPEVLIHLACTYIF